MTPSPPRVGLLNNNNEPLGSGTGLSLSLHTTPQESLVHSKIVEYHEPKKCGEKTKTILKEFFVAGDVEDAVLSIDELVGLGDDEGHVVRGAAVVEAGVLLVMEMKELQVIQFQTLMAHCLVMNALDGRNE